MRPVTLSASGRMEIEDSASSNVYPSGFALATYAMPMPPPAPALFSMMTGVARLRLIASPKGRATMSATPPGGNGTTNAIGFDG